MARSRIENHPDHIALAILRFDAVRPKLVGPALAFVLVGILQHVVVKLEDQRLA